MGGQVTERRSGTSRLVARNGAIEVEQKPSLGRIVLFRGQFSNSANEHPAIITRVWSDTTVNLTVFLDASTAVVKTSVVLDEDMNSGAQYSWRWPPRV